MNKLIFIHRLVTLLKISTSFFYNNIYIEELECCNIIAPLLYSVLTSILCILYVFISLISRARKLETVIGYNASLFRNLYERKNNRLLNCCDKAF